MNLIEWNYLIHHIHVHTTSPPHDKGLCEAERFQLFICVVFLLLTWWPFQPLYFFLILEYLFIHWKLFFPHYLLFVLYNTFHVVWLIFSTFSQELNNEISEKQAQLLTLTQASDNIAQCLSIEGATAIKGKVNEMKAKINKLAEDVRHRLNATSDTILTR